MLSNLGPSHLKVNNTKQVNRFFFFFWLFFPKCVQQLPLNCSFFQIFARCQFTAVSPSPQQWFQVFSKGHSIGFFCMPSLNWIVSDIFLDNPRLRHRQNAQDQCLVMRQITFSSPRAKVAARSSLIRKKIYTRKTLCKYIRYTFS